MTMTQWKIRMGLLLTGVALSAVGWENALKPEGTPVEWRPAAEYSVLLPETPTSQDEFAAGLLSGAVEKMTGVRWPVVREPEAPTGPFVSLGATRAAAALGDEGELKADGYRIRERDGNWFFTGGVRRGPINAVLAFMEEDLGWRDYSVFVPQHFPDWRNRALTAVPRAYSPPLEAREVHIREAWNPEWVLLNRATPMFDPTGPQVSAEAGGSPCYPVGGWFAHSFARLAPDQALFATHPEYFAQKGDRRVPNDICLSNPETVKIVADKAIAILDANPGATFFGISQNDGTAAVCQCEKCRALAEAEGSNSAPVLDFVNRAAELIHRKYPDVKITTLAYMETYRPPATIRPGKNVVIFLATDRHMWAHPFHFIDETTEFQDALRAWSDTGAEIHLWDYTFGDNAHWMNPSPNFDVLAYNLRFFLRFPGVNGVLFQDNYCSVGDSRGALKNWLLTKLMWNPAWDEHALERDYTLGYYGAAGEAMQAYNELLRDEWRRYHDASRPEERRKFQVSDEFLPQAQALIDRAFAAVADDPLLTAEVKREAACLLYQRLEKGVQSPDDRAAYLADVDRMRAWCDELGIHSFAEAGGREQKFQTWELLADRVQLPPSTPHALRLWLDTVSLPQVCGPANASITADAKAAGGHAILQPGAENNWSIQWPLPPFMFLNAHGRYLVRVRARLGEATAPSGPAMMVGLWNGGNVFQKVFQVEDFKGQDYVWLDAAWIEAPLEGTFYLGAAEHAAVKDLYVEMIELIPETEADHLQ